MLNVYYSSVCISYSNLEKNSRCNFVPCLFFVVPPSSVRVWVQNERNGYLQSYSSDHRDYSPPQNLPSIFSVKENTEAHLACEAYGSRPQAFIMWRKNGRVITNTEVGSTTQSSVTNNISTSGDAATLSLLTIVPTVADHETVISCTTYNSKLPDEVLMDEITLDVLCK